VKGIVVIVIKWIINLGDYRTYS